MKEELPTYKIVKANHENKVVLFLLFLLLLLILGVFLSLRKLKKKFEDLERLLQAQA